MSDPGFKNSVPPAGERSATADAVRADAERAMEDVRDRAHEGAETLQRQAAERTATVADGLHAAADRLSGDEDALANQVRQAANQLDGFAQRLQGNSLEDTVREVEDFGRRNPAMMMGIAVALGFGLGRVATARAGGSTPRHTTAPSTLGTAPTYGGDAL